MPTDVSTFTSLPHNNIKDTDKITPSDDTMTVLTKQCPCKKNCIEHQQIKIEVRVNGEPRSLDGSQCVKCDNSPGKNSAEKCNTKV